VKIAKGIHAVHMMRRSLWITLTLGLLTLTAVAGGQSRLPDVTHEGIEVKEVWIPMPDGVRLAASLFMPANREATDTFPVLLEYLPYRKDESRKGRFALFSYFVARGYVVARVDIRGTGTSEGKLIEYEYTDQEQEDGEVVIDWLSKQAWSTAKVGMFGISWGAFNSIQMAMRNPPALKAIVAVEGTDDLFRDDCHFIDGMMHIDSYEFGQDVSNALPAPPDYVIDEAYFRDRFDTEPWLLTYKRQQRDGPFWNRASLDSDYSSIDIPTFVIGGWYDGYRDSVPRMLEKLDAPVKGMVGPWAHTWPNRPYPEPGMEWRHEAVRWFDQWLKAEDTGILGEPRFAVYVRQWYPPGVVDNVPGYWRWEDGWPIERTRDTAVFARADHTFGMSGAQRRSSEEPESLVPGQLFKLEYDLHFTSWVFPKGHRIRLAVNNALWPMIWPTPYAMTTMLEVEGPNASHIVLPVMPESDGAGPEFLPPAENPELPGYAALELDDDSVSGYAETRSIERIPLSSKTRIVASGASGSVHLGTKIKYSEEIVHEAQDTDPARASVTGKTRYTVELDGRTLTVEGVLSFTSDREDFFYTYTRRVLENGKLIREKTWDEAIPRDHH
jgi:predicted acyl esterase